MKLFNHLVKRVEHVDPGLQAIRDQLAPVREELVQQRAATQAEIEKWDAVAQYGTPQRQIQAPAELARLEKELYQEDARIKFVQIEEIARDIKRRFATLEAATPFRAELKLDREKGRAIIETNYQPSTSMRTGSNLSISVGDDLGEMIREYTGRQLGSGQLSLWFNTAAEVAAAVTAQVSADVEVDDNHKLYFRKPKPVYHYSGCYLE